MVDPVTIGAVAKVVTPGHVDAVGNAAVTILEKTGSGVGQIFTSVGNMGTGHHQISANKQVEEAKILAGMSPEQLKIYLDYKKASNRPSLLETAASFTPLGPILTAKRLMEHAMA